ncbi:MAG: IS200/IS605 family transposase [Candidatus Electryonea clarkiae]|nr:IS200/IS605 family transposase [Candidatus Electryonea clarkiae]MDP8287429.1 IS200/IS605 family transposase [Candidatus Electryonea clarkiae]
MAHSYHNCLYHFVFSTYQRKNTVSGQWIERLWKYMGGIARKNEMKALCIGGTKNHVHLLLIIPAKISPAKAIQLIKGGSAKWVHDNFSDSADFSWQEGYGVFTVGFSQIEATIQYINNQREHHKVKTFEEEYTAFLEKHQIQYENKYMFG